MGGGSCPVGASARRDRADPGLARMYHAAGVSVSEVFRGDDNGRRTYDHREQRAWDTHDQSAFI